MQKYRSNHMYISLNQVQFEKTVKRFLISLESLIYIQRVQYEQPQIFDVEPRYGKKFMEPDVFTIWRKSPFFIEVQKSLYSKSVMQQKINRYECCYTSLEWQRESWQPKNSKFFPSILMITDKYYEIYSSNLRIFQANSINELINKIKVSSK